jgi:magnesium-transporting ATPase (P-type)
MEFEFDITVGTSNLQYESNQIIRAKNKLLIVPFITIKKYFLSYENIYFLIIALFQLSTLCILPKEWSPTGPYSTAIPLLLCVLLEIITDLSKWYQNWKLDYNENNKTFKCLDSRGKLYDKKNKDIYPGDIVYLQKEDISPIDGLLLDTSNNEKYSKTNLALLTGESNTCFVTKLQQYYKLDDYKDCIITIENYYQNNFHHISGTLQKDSEKFNIKGENFIVGGSIIKSEDMYILVVRCGKNKKGYLEKNILEHKYSRVDKFIGSYMIKVSTILLFGMIFVSAFFKMFLISTFSPDIFFFIIIQNWILFNGIIPFSVKIFILFSKSIQSYIYNQNSKKIIINNSCIIDDLGKIDRILSDKTGTITKNELEFIKIISLHGTKVIDIENFNGYDISLEFHKCLGICIHQTDGVFSTNEDKTIRYRYQYLNNKISQHGDRITLDISGEQYHFEYLEVAGLDFTFERRLSSKVVKSENKYYIYSKGSLDIIKKKIKPEFNKELQRLDNLISQQYPELRLLGCAFRELEAKEIGNLYLESSNSELIKQLENNLDFLGIVGIKDNLQDGVPKTINHLKNIGLYTSLLTGDRKITAMTIGIEAGIIDNQEWVFDYNLENLDKKGQYRQTLMFNGDVVEHVFYNNKYYEIFSHNLINCKNFIGYNLIPEHKKKLALILEDKGIRTLTIGDGFNDLGMFNVSSTSVAIKGNNFVEHNADLVVQEFNGLREIINFSIDAYYKNSKIINFTFYRTALVMFSIFMYSLINYQSNESLFNGFVIQAFNFAWTLPGIGYLIIKNNCIKYKKKDFNNQQVMLFSKLEYTILWNISGAFVGILVTLLTYQWFKDHKYMSDILGIVIIVLLNLKLQSNKLDIVLVNLLGVVFFVCYMSYIGSLSYVLAALWSVHWGFWLQLIIIYLGTTFIFS